MKNAIAFLALLTCFNTFAAVDVEKLELYCPAQQDYHDFWFNEEEHIRVEDGVVYHWDDTSHLVMDKIDDGVYAYSYNGGYFSAEFKKDDEKNDYTVTLKYSTRDVTLTLNCLTQ